MIKTYEEYLEECARVQATYPSWRWGQTLFNVLSESRPDLSKKVHGTELDTFYADHATKRREKIDGFLRFVRENW